MRHRVRIGYWLCVLLILFPVSAHLQRVEAAECKVGFVYPAPVGDAGWAQSHDAARQAVAQLPGVTTTFIESVPEGPVLEMVLRNLAQQGCRVVFAASFGYMDSVVKVAREFPDTIFMHCGGYKRDRNIGTYFGRIHEAEYLAGIVAGGMTKTNQIGFVGAYPIAEVVRNINAFTLGVRSVNPAATVHVAWTGTWFDPPREKKVALRLLDTDIDVLAQHQDSPACQIAAREKGKYSIGYNTDMSRFAQGVHLTSAVWNWTPLYQYIVEQIQAGTWKSEDLWWGLDKGVVDIAPFGSMVPQDIQETVLAKKAEIIAGKFQIFAGPIEDQEGRVRIAEGRTASDADLLNMTWLVKGVEGKIE